MSSHHTRGQLLKHYKMEEEGKARRLDAAIARREAFDETRATARAAGLAVQQIIRAARLDAYWLTTTRAGLQLLWLATIATITLTALRVIG